MCACAGVCVKAGGRGKGDAPGITIRTLAFALRWGNQCRVVTDNLTCVFKRSVVFRRGDSRGFVHEVTGGLQLRGAERTANSNCNDPRER